MNNLHSGDHKIAVHSLSARTHSFIKLLVAKSMGEGITYQYHNGRKLAKIDQPERIVSQIMPYFLRLVFLEISSYYGTPFQGLHFHATKKTNGTFHFDVNIVEPEIKNQLEYFSFLSYVFNYVFLKNKFHEDLTLLVKTSKFV